MQDIQRISNFQWRIRFAVVWLLAMVGCAIDLGTKQWVFGWLGPPSRRVHWLWQDYIGIETSINTGALAGIGSGHISALATISVLALVGILIWIVFGRALDDWTVAIAIGLILGGIMGNLYDRLGLWGQRGVRDWILLRYESFTWPNFNVADSLLVCGSALLVLHAFVSSRDSRPAGEPVVSKAA